MRLLPRAIPFAATIVSLACAHAEPLSNAYSRVDAEVGDRCAFGARSDRQCEIYDVALVELLAVPEKFQGKRVRLIGFASLRFEGNVLCADNTPAGACLWLDIEGLSDPGFRNGWAQLEGRFNGENRGHFGCCPGSLEHITSFKKWRR